MPTIQVPGIDDERRDEVTADLQALVVDLVALSLNAKQAHWHVVGRQFGAVHAQLDTIVDAVRAHSDAIAERSVTLGVPVDARPSAVAELADVAEVPDGWLGDDKVVPYVADALCGVIERTRARLARIGELDPVTEGLLVDMLADLEKHVWMLRARIT